MSREYITSLLRPNIAELVPYASARNEFSGEADVFLDANENWQDFLGGTGYNRYPDPKQKLLKQKIETVLGLKSESLILGNGSDEIIDLLFRVFCVPAKDSAMILPPTYGAYRVFADINDIEVKTCSLRDDFMIDFPALETALNEEKNSRSDGRCKLLFICSPNNPTGNAFDKEDIERVLNLFDGMVVVDEAYIEFSQTPSAVELLETYDRLIILRTLSKSWGLANVRVGMAIASPVVVESLHNTKYPYNLSGPAQTLAIAALEKQEAVLASAAQTVGWRDELAKELEALSCILKVFPSQANFLLVKVADADKLYAWMKRQGIILRNRSRETRCAGCIRITVGSREENARLLTYLKRYEQEEA